MSTQIIENTDSIELLDFDIDVVCEADDDCNNPATFVITTICCGARVLICEDCWFHWLDYFRAHKDHVKFICTLCDTTQPPGESPFRFLHRIKT